MNTWIARTLAVLAAIAAGFGFVSTVAANVTVSPATVSVNLLGNTSFRVTYGSTAFSDGACSPEGGFYSAATGGSLLGRIISEVRIPNDLTVPQAVQEQVTIPAAVIQEIKRRGNTTEMYYRRNFTPFCGKGSDYEFDAVVRILIDSTTVEAIPATARVASGTDTLVSVRWKLTLASGVRALVESREGWFKDGRGQVHGAAVRDLLQATGRSRAEIDETLRVPESVVKSILRARGETGMRFERTFLVDGVQMIGTLLLQPANAIQSVSPQPARIAVTTQSPGSASLRWNITLLPGVTGPAGSSLSLTSTEGVFLSPEGRILGRVSTPLSQPVPATSALSARAVAAAGAVSEQLSIPHAVVDAAMATGFTWFTFRRTFRVGNDSAPGELRLDFAGRIAANFGIDRAELRFLDGSRFKTVQLGEEIQVEADITFHGSGRLRGSWDLAGPTTTPGMAIFVRKQLVDEYLSFGRRTLIRSPAIKTDQPGVYIARLTITAPEFGVEASRLQVSFVVRATGAAVEISLVQPQPLARLAPGLPFSWEAVAGARNYLLEFYDVPSAEGREPAAGMVLPGGESRAALSQATERNFQSGRSYWWRVVALGPDGVLLGQSPLRELLTPQE